MGVIMVFWIIFMIAVALVMIIGIERLIARLGVRPVNPEETRTGLSQIAARLEAWSRRTRPR
jgi:uncharacterized membrane-anchored protein YhcB (DUF1043 family)